jgi:hypothetical protein
MELKSLMVHTKDAWVEFPGLDGFEVKVVNLARKELISLRKRCVTQKFDRKTRQPIEELDDEKFIAEFTRATIKGWKGLKLKYLETLLLVDISGKDPEAELDYSSENAEHLVSNSADFDTWLNETVFELDNFRSQSAGANVAATGKVVQ